MRTLLVLLLCVGIALPGCATAGAATGRSISGTPVSGGVNTAVMADYVRQLKVGSRVRISRADHSVIRAILMKNDGDPIVVQRRTRIPEAPIEIAMQDILAVELDASNGSTGRAVAIGAASAAGATLGILLLLAAIFSD
jgi:hypothetical protein